MTREIIPNQRSLSGSMINCYKFTFAQTADSIQNMESRHFINRNSYQYHSITFMNPFSSHLHQYRKNEARERSRCYRSLLITQLYYLT